MERLLNNRKGVILIAAALAVIVVLGLSAAFFLRSVSEKRVVDVEKFSMQADFLAEAGAGHGLSELRDRINSDLSSKVAGIANGTVLDGYYDDGDSLEFLRDYAYGSGDTQFTVSGGEATLDLSALTIVTNVDGTYSAQIVVTEAAEPDNPETDSYIFYYNYVIKGTGVCSAMSPNITKKVNISGSFSLRVIRDNLATYALFTNHHTSSSGGLVWFTEATNFYGPVRTNEYLRFAHNPGPYFSHQVSQHEDMAQFYNNGSYIFLNDDHNGVIDVPTFDTGFERSVGEVNLQSAISSTVAKLEALGGMSEPETDGVYLPNTEGALTGGIYIKGTVTELELEVDDGNPKYSIHQSGGAVTRVTVDYDSNTTTVIDTLGNPTTYTGVPNGIADEGTVIYTAGSISEFGGTVDGDSVVTVCSEGNITITDHVMYENYNAGPPVNATGYDNMLGIVSFGGDVRIGMSAPSNINIHGIVMAPSGQFTVEGYYYGINRGTATLLGGVISNYYGPFGTFYGTGYSRNFVHDGRVLSGQTPAYFLSMTNFVSYEEGLDSRPIWQKVEN